MGVLNSRETKLAWWEEAKKTRSYELTETTYGPRYREMGSHTTDTGNLVIIDDP